jgi:hypothetical protein
MAVVNDLTREQIYSSDIYLSGTYQSYHSEAGQAIVAVGSKWPRTKKSRSLALITETPKYNLQTYEDMYVRIGILHEAINKISETMVENGFGIGPPSHLLQEEDFKLDDIKGLRENIKFVRQWARYINLGKKMVEMMKPGLWAGTSYSEIVYDENSKWRITHLKVLDPKEIRVVRSPTGDTLGYVQYPTKGMFGSILSKSQSNFLVNEKGGIFFEPEDMLEIKWDNLPTAAYGTSIFESLKDIMAVVVGMFEDMGVTVKNFAMPTTHFMLGTDNIPATRKAIDKFKSYMNNVDAGQDIITGTNVKGETIKDPTKTLDVPKYLRAALNMLYAALGVPEILFGQGNETTEATAKSQMEAAAKKFRTFQRLVQGEIEMKLFARLIKNVTPEELEPDDMDEIPELWFSPIETAEEKRIRFIEAVKTGAFSKQDLRRAYGMEREIIGDVVLSEDKEFQLELAEAGQQNMFGGGGGQPSSGPAQQKPKTKEKPKGGKKPK